MAGRFDGQRLTLDEVARFGNGPVRVGERLFWDVLGLWSNLSDGLRAAATKHGGAVANHHRLDPPCAPPVPSGLALAQCRHCVNPLRLPARPHLGGSAAGSPLLRSGFGRKLRAFSRLARARVRKHGVSPARSAAGGARRNAWCFRRRALA